MGKALSNKTDTIKVTVHLTKYEAAALMEMAAAANCTGPADLLEGFTADLTESKRNHGSDERSAAWAYYDRSVYGLTHHCPNARSWLQELLVINGTMETGYDSVMDVLRIADEYNFNHGQIEWAADEEERKLYKEEAKKAKEELKEEYKRYLELTKCKPEATSMRKELANIRRWVKAYHKMGLSPEDAV